MNWYRVLTGPNAAGVAVIGVEGEGVGRFLREGCGREVLVGRLGHVQLKNAVGELVDDPVVWRASEGRAEVSVHGGPEIVRQVCSVMEGEGFVKVLQSNQLDLLSLCETERAVRAVVEGWSEERRKWLLQAPTVAVVGEANVGKSTLVNALSGVEASITADVAGTTRDFVVVEGVVGEEFGGMVVKWMDLPGFRETADAIEGEAIGIARDALETADAVIFVVGETRDFASETSDFKGAEGRVIRVAGRADLWRGEVPGDLLRVSAVTGEGVGELKRRVAGLFEVE